MAFWSSANLDPKRQFKFKVTFSRLGTEAQYLAQSAGRPQFTISDGVKVDFLDKSYHYPGKITWEPVTIKFVDAVQSSVSKASYDYLKATGWVENDRIASGTPNFATISKARAVAASGVVMVDVIDSEGAIVDSWSLHNAFITKVALNELDYAAEGILTAIYTMRYDWASLQ